MKRTAPLSLLALGAVVSLTVLAGQTSPKAPAGSKGVPAATGAGGSPTSLSPPASPGAKGHGHVWQHQPERPAQSVGRTLTPEMIDLCMQVARDIDESLATKLAALRSRDVRQFEAQLRASRRLTALAELKKRDPSSYDLKIVELRVDATVSRLAADARGARKAGQMAEARSLEQQLEGQVILQLAFRYRARENYLCQLRELVERLERDLKEEQENFDGALADRMAELLADPETTRQPGDPDAKDPADPDPLLAIDVAARRIVPE